MFLHCNLEGEGKRPWRYAKAINEPGLDQNDTSAGVLCDEQHANLSSTVRRGLKMLDTASTEPTATSSETTSSIDPQNEVKSSVELSRKKYSKSCSGWTIMQKRRVPIQTSGPDMMERSNDLCSWSA